MEPHNSHSQLLLHPPPSTTSRSPQKLALIPLIFLIFFEVSGGPIPEALITAELATLFPGNGGFVIWADQAFGPFWGSLMGLWKFLTGVLNLGSCIVLCIDYLKLLFPVLASGLAIVGYTAVALGVISLSPFIDNASTLAGEVEDPQKNYPKALFCAGLLACLGYLVPLLVATGAVPLNQADWTDGYLATVAEMIAGKWLKIWVEIGACLSVVGLYEAQLSSCVYQLLGMADLGFLPKFFGVRSKWFSTPWIGILLSTIIALTGSYMDFTNIISLVNFLYCLGMLLEFASFLWLRKKWPNIKRPYRVPIGLSGLVIMCLIPCGFLVYVMAVATTTVYMVSAIFTFIGIFWYFFMKICKSKKWVQFSNAEELGFERLE
ncbi:amino acid transporter, putative [Ricinus communis]|uniref:Amino acid transporter, putative n=1 Tax=Ricinus communis TaxID=3988 RepID=B9SM55_RICCO|nr:amino acid transporter, putative [Ricinus communis]